MGQKARTDETREAGTCRDTENRMICHCPHILRGKGRMEIQEFREPESKGRIEEMECFPRISFAPWMKN